MVVGKIPQFMPVGPRDVGGKNGHLLMRFTRITPCPAQERLFKHTDVTPRLEIVAATLPYRRLTRVQTRLYVRDGRLEKVWQRKGAQRIVKQTDRRILRLWHRDQRQASVRRLPE